ncbi:MAG: hypothetical protein ABID84_01515 [Chloroflexota bacterium]
MSDEREALEIPFPDPLGLLQGEAQALQAPVVPMDPLAGVTDMTTS